MIEVLITGAVGGLLFYFIGSGFNKMQGNIQKNRIEKRLSSGTIERMDLVLALNYYSNSEKIIKEGEKYVILAEQHFPNDREVNEVIFNYFMIAKDYNKAMEKVDEMIEKFPEDAGILFGKGYCLFNLNEKEQAEEFRTRAILLDKSFKNRPYK